jgi:hypothetical protein
MFNANKSPYQTSDLWWCDELRKYVDVPSSPLVYLSSFREFGLIASPAEPVLQKIDYCPFCGAKFPKSLRDEWFERIWEMGLDSNSQDIPDRFRGDEWWRVDSKVSA